ncbi:MAG: protein arginine kinase [Acetobacteraceae bacterium]|nr:protein arginine kinase [Acetobacteraceae bacterium]
MGSDAPGPASGAGPWETDEAGKWLDGTGPEAGMVVSSRVRLARNLEGHPFPHLLDQAGGEKVLSLAQDVTREINNFGHFGEFKHLRLASLRPLDRRVLVEKHLISPHHAEGGGSRGVILNREGTVSIMVNEEDHFRIQCLSSGLDLAGAYDVAGRIDDLMGERISYAFDPRLGYLTACPTNVGTGLRASVMMHLPALVMTDQAGRVTTAMSKVGVVVRGFFGEGTQASGDYFQISNQITLGRSEASILDDLGAVVREVSRQEAEARESLLRGRRHSLEDRVWRAYGVLGSARILSTDEAMRLLSEVRLGVELGFLPRIPIRVLNRLLVVTRPGYLQRLAGRELAPADRDLRRAELVRRALRSWNGRGGPGRGDPAAGAP